MKKIQKRYKKNLFPLPGWQHNYENSGEEEYCANKKNIVAAFSLLGGTLAGNTNILQIKRKLSKPFPSHSLVGCSPVTAAVKSSCDTTTAALVPRSLGAYAFISSLGFFVFVFIGPESDHWLCLSVTDSLTDSLTNSLLFSKLD